MLLATSRVVIVVLLGLALSANLYGEELLQSSLTWREIDDGTATLLVSGINAGENWTSTIKALGENAKALPVIKVEYSRNIPNPSGSTDVVLRLYREDHTSSIGEQAQYLLIVEGREGNPAKTFRELRLLTVRPLLDLLEPKLIQGSAKYVLTTSRAFPFIDDWTIENSLVLRKPAGIAPLKSVEHIPLGVVSGQLPGGMNVSAIVKWGTFPSQEGKDKADSIPLEIVFSRWLSGKMEGILTFPGGQTLNVVVQTSDHIFYPIAAILVGVFAAYKVKRYLTRGRPALVLKATLEETEHRLLTAIETFQRAAGTQIFSTYGISWAWQKFRNQTEADIRQLELQGVTLDQSSSVFSALYDRINSQRKLPDAWMLLSDKLCALEKCRIRIHHLIPPSGLQGPPLIENEILTIEQGFELSSVDAVDALVATVDALNSSVGLWVASWEQSEWFINNGGVAPEIGVLIESAQKILWGGFNGEALNKANQVLRQASDILSKPSIVGRREAAGPAVSIQPTPILPPNRISETKRIERFDTTVFAVTLTLAVAVGLNAEYFGKPFGSVEDYVRVLAWALSTSIGVELTTLALGRVSSMLNLGATTVTRH